MHAGLLHVTTANSDLASGVVDTEWCIAVYGLTCTAPWASERHPNVLCLRDNVHLSHVYKYFFPHKSHDIFKSSHFHNQSELINCAHDALTGNSLLTQETLAEWNEERISEFVNNIPSNQENEQTKRNKAIYKEGM